MELQKLSWRILKLQDEERRRIARDLHDVTGQTLAALKMAVVDLERRIQRDANTTSVLREIEQLAEQALREIRTTSYLLHPPLLDEIGFCAAAEWYVEGFAKRSGMNAKLDLPTEVERMPIAIETALFRILQESVTNVHRYSGSSEVRVHFQRQAETAILEIADCGRGIPVEILKRLEEGSTANGVGIASMHERMIELNGELKINSSECGTSVRAIVPLLTKDLPVPWVDYSSVASYSPTSGPAR